MQKQKIFRSFILARFYCLPIANEMQLFYAIFRDAKRRKQGALKVNLKTHS